MNKIKECAALILYLLRVCVGLYKCQTSRASCTKYNLTLACLMHMSLYRDTITNKTQP